MPDILKAAWLGSGPHAKEVLQDFQIRNPKSDFQIRNPKSEARNKFQARNSKDAGFASVFVISVFRHSGLFRISCFVLRASCCVLPASCAWKYCR
jgi:hypothetical protein